MDWCNVLEFQASGMLAWYKSWFCEVFLAISPTGTVTFISKYWGGYVSNHFLTANSGLLWHLKHGHLVIADRGR